MGISKKIALYIIIEFSGLRNILLFINGNLTRAEGIHTHATIKVAVAKYFVLMPLI